MNHAAYDWQQLNFRDRQRGGLTWDMVRITAERQGKERIRARPDKRIFDAMTVEQEAAFCKIQTAYSVKTNGIGYKVQRFEDTGKVTGAGNVEYGAGLIAHYKAWRTLCQQRGISGLMAEDVIVFGLTLGESDAARAMRKGTAKENLFRCLDAWGDVREGDVQTILDGVLKKPLTSRGRIREDFC